MTPAVRYIWRPSRPVFRGKKMCVSPCNTSQISCSFSAWSLIISGGTSANRYKRKKKTSSTAASTSRLPRDNLRDKRGCLRYLLRRDVQDKAGEPGSQKASKNCKIDIAQKNRFKELNLFPPKVKKARMAEMAPAHNGTEWTVMGSRRDSSIAGNGASCHSFRQWAKTSQ